MLLRAALIALIPSLLWTLMPPAALGDTATVSDDRDTGDVMDLALARHKHSTSTPKRLVHDFEMWDPWRNDEFIQAELRIWLPDKEPKVDRIISVYKNTDGSLVAEIRGKRFVGYANVWRPDEVSLRLEFPRRSLASPDRYMWKAFVFYPCSRNPDEQCEPVPPDTHPGRIRHRL